MTPQQLEKRRRVMRRSMALGHCICDVRRPCPCDVFKEKDICPCAGERVPVGNGPVRLTEHVRNAGCASKISKGVLDEVLEGLPEIEDRRVVVGASAGDDAGVIMLSEETATILTVDVFSPAVDDPYTFGQIAAANSLSDVYAMGGTPQVALSIIGFPIHTLPAAAMREILRGGVEKMREAGVCVIGGHSINDEEVKCGFAVVGTCAKGGFVRNAGAKAGDAIVLTKPLGSGIAVFAHQVGRASDEMVARVGKSMATLNKLAGQLMVEHGAHAATDVTGFSLLGHMAEIVKNSRVEAEIDFDAIRLFEGVAELAAGDVLPGAVERNRESVEESLLDMGGLSAGQQAALFGPETSGGLLVFMPERGVGRFLAELREGGVEGVVIGRVARACEGGRIRVMTKRAKEFGNMATEPKAAQAEGGSCCCGDEAAAGSVTATGDGLPAAAGGEAFKAYMAAVGKGEALGLKVSKLISVALSVMSKCEPCVKINAKAAREAGASEQEIAEAVSLGIAFGGAPVAMFYNMVRQK